MNVQHFSPLFWSQWLANDLPWGRRVRGAWHLRRCSHCRAAARHLRAAQAAFEASDDFARSLAALQRRQATAVAPMTARLNPGIAVALSRRLWPSMAWVGSMGAVLLALWHQPESPALLRAKGTGAHFALYVQREDAVSPLTSQCRPKDAIRASYQSTQPYLLVVEVDGHGEAQTVFPAAGTESARISAGRQLTPGSWVLDDSPHQERFVALFSDRPLTLQASYACVRTPSACGAQVTRREVVCSKD